MSDTVKAATIHVPADQPTIQAGIDAAVSGVDEVVVAPGTYVLAQSIDLLGKTISLRSTGPNDPNVVAATILDGQNNGFHVVQCVSGEGVNTVISGFTITRWLDNWRESQWAQRRDVQRQQQSACHRLRLRLQWGQ